jgi:hypothetical protein
MNTGFSAKLFFLLAFFLLIVTSAIDGMIYYSLHYLLNIPPVSATLIKLSEVFFTTIVPLSVAVYTAFTVLLWVTLKAFINNSVSTVPDAQSSPEEQKSDAQLKILQDKRDKRLFLHLFSILQKEGRLMDFFAEDLEQFEDDQIGAAVRTIHENCKKALYKYLSPESVIDSNEGEAIEVKENFNTEEIKLVGNVAGNPPFKGVLRHKGWKTKDFDLPVLAKTDNPLVIAPGEVEVE